MKHFRLRKRERREYTAAEMQDYNDLEMRKTGILCDGSRISHFNRVMSCTIAKYCDKSLDERTIFIPSFVVNRLNENLPIEEEGEMWYDEKDMQLQYYDPEEGISKPFLYWNKYPVYIDQGLDGIK